MALDFVVAGPPESGGDWLAAALTRHPNLRLADPAAPTRAPLARQQAADAPAGRPHPGYVPAGRHHPIDAPAARQHPAGLPSARHLDGIVAPYLLADFTAQRRLHE